jgi:hypothetical protein
MKKYFLFIIMSGIILSACKNDLDVNAEYKETMVVYGILDQTDSLQYIKVTKAFLGEADAAQMALVRDSSEYPDVLDVKIIERRNNQTINHTLERRLITNKNAGNFYAPNQYVYAFLPNLFRTSPIIGYLDETKIVKLQITNRLTGKSTEAETEIVKNFIIRIPSASAFTSIPLATQTNNFLSPTDYNLVWEISPNAKRYSVNFRLTVIDTNLVNPSLSKRYTIEYGSSKIKPGSSDREITFAINARDFISLIASKLPDAGTDNERWLADIDVFIAAAGEELDIYMTLNEPSASIVTERPIYSNLSDGIGIFSSRINKQILNKGITQNTAKYLKENYPQKKFTQFYIQSTNSFAPIN